MDLRKWFRFKKPKNEQDKARRPTSSPHLMSADTYAGGGLFSEAELENLRYDALSQDEEVHTNGSDHRLQAFLSPKTTRHVDVAIKKRMPPSLATAPNPMPENEARLLAGEMEIALDERYHEMLSSVGRYRTIMEHILQGKSPQETAKNYKTAIAEVWMPRLERAVKNEKWGVLWERSETCRELLGHKKLQFLSYIENEGIPHPVLPYLDFEEMKRSIMLQHGLVPDFRIDVPKGFPRRER